MSLKAEVNICIWTKAEINVFTYTLKSL